MESSENKYWEFIDTGENTGEFNMDFDSELVERCKDENKSFLRFYKWKPYCISLGYNQGKVFNDNNIDIDKCKHDGVDVVYRPTGGRAVLHSEELTYSVVMKSEEPVQKLHNQISDAIVYGLKLINTSNNELQQITLANSTPDLFKLAKTGMYNLCFNTSIKHEINFKGKKLVGSAQRKMGNIVLQHGSILIGTHHKQIVNYLKLPDGKLVKKIFETLSEKTICLNELLGRQVSYDEATSNVKLGFERTFNINFTRTKSVA